MGKTNETEIPVADYVGGIKDEKRRADVDALIALMKEATGFEPKMWGPSIVGFGSYHYKYESGHEGDAPLAGLSSRASAITLYLALYDGRDDDLARLGKHTTGKGCVYVKKLADLDTDVFKEIVAKSFEARRMAHA